MSFQETSKFCKYCNRQVLARKKGINHILHLLLTIFTSGIWIIAWILCVAENNNDNWRCGICGQEIGCEDFTNKKSSGLPFWCKLAISGVWVGIIIVFIWEGVKLL